MEQPHSGHLASGAPEADDRSALSRGSTASLMANAATSAGYQASEGGRRGPSQEADAGAPIQAVDNSTQQHTTAVAPDKVPFYKRRRFIVSMLIIVPLAITLLFVLLFPVVRAIVQLVVNRTLLDIQLATITQPQNSTFSLELQGIVTHTGIISAKIQFLEPANVSWVEDSGSETPLGVLTLPTLSAKHKRASINATTDFNITDQAAFGRFSRHLITAPGFTWRIKSSNLRVQALKFPVAKGISFNKLLTLNGFNNFNEGVVLKDLQLPSDHSGGGIDFRATTQLTNRSPFSLSLGTVILGLSYQNVFLGKGSSSDTVIRPGINDIKLEGVLERKTDPADLAEVSRLFTNYLNGDSSPVIATGESTLQPDNTTISWLSDGIQSLRLNVSFQAPDRIDPIRSITIDELNLLFDDQSPWSPRAESDSVHAKLELPFGFNVAIDQIKNELNIVTDDGADVAGLSTPLGASRSSIAVLSPTDTEGIINITISNTNLSCPDPQHQAFSKFNADLTSLNIASFRLVGHSHAVANTSIGQITLDPIKINVSTILNGLQGLKELTTIANVDVQGGSQEGIELGIDVSIFNPSSLSISVGDLALLLLRDGVTLGSALLPNLTLHRGNNTLRATSSFKANDSPQGLQTLNDFVGKKDVQLSIAGFNRSTAVASLAEAFQSLDINVTLPALQSDLIDTAKLTVLSSTGRENNISHVAVSLVNPFSVPLEITRISSTVKSFDIPLGKIEANTKFVSAPRSTTLSPVLDLIMNFDPAALFTLTRSLALEAGMDVDPLDEIVKIGGIQYLSTNNNPPKTKRRANVFKDFNLPSFVQAAFKKLRSDVELRAEVTIGDYKTVLQYTQTNVPTVTDDTLNFILPILARPIVQIIVDGSSLGISNVVITEPEETSFRTALRGNITNTGPFDAVISFPSGLVVSWSNKILGRIKMTDVQVTGDVGGPISSTTAFAVADTAHLTDFTKILLNGESFDWSISGDNLAVDAIGIKVTGLSLSSKKVTLNGFNGLKGGVAIETFDLPSNDPTGGIRLTLEVTIVNPSQVGIALSSIGFETLVDDVSIAAVASTEPVALLPSSTSHLSLAGRLVPQTSSSGLSAVSHIFNAFLHGRDSGVEVRGTSAGDVSWLNKGIQSLRIATVLPNRGPLDIIKSIKLDQLQLIFTDQAPYGPITSSQLTDVAFTLPFGFPIDIVSLEQTLTTGFEGTSFAQLELPEASSRTDVKDRIIHLTFDHVPFAVFEDRHPTFDKFIAATTVGKTQTLQLSGSANANAQTAVGLLSLQDIRFSVASLVDGLQGLSTRPVIISNVEVTHGFPDFLLIKVSSSLFNPSNLTIGTGDVSFTLEFKGQIIGIAQINSLLIKPGDGNYSIDVHFAPQGAAIQAGRDLLQSFLQGIDVDTTIFGTQSSTSIASLKTALSQIRLSPVTIPALHKTLISSTSLAFPVDIVKTGVASSFFTLANPFEASVSLLRVGATATFGGILLGTINAIDTSSNPIHAAGHSSVESPALPFNFNLHPAAIIRLLEDTSRLNGVDLGPLTPLFDFVLDNPDFKPPVVTSVDMRSPTCVSGHQFDATGAILKSLDGLKVDLAVDVSAKIDDYATDLSFDQNGVPTVTDKTALFLIGAVAAPVAQHLVDGSELKFTEANITDISETGFNISLAGSLTNVGPLDALIDFREPLAVEWQGRHIANIALPPVCSAANVGVPDYRVKARVTITQPYEFTLFATFLLHNPKFDWTISSSKLRLTALGTIFDNVNLRKVVTFKAFDGLPGVFINNFQLPFDDPAGGIHIETDAVIPSPAQLGIELGTVTFQSFFQDTLVGPLTAKSLFLTANSNTESHLSGRILPQSGNDLNTMGVLFSRFLNGENQTLVVKGDSVLPSGSGAPIRWLSTAFKSLSLQVVLPGQRFKVIQSISLNDLFVTIDTPQQSFAPPTSSKFTLATYKNPFGFSLQVTESGQNIILESQGIDVAELTLPKVPSVGGISTGNSADLVISFRDAPLKALDRAAFVQFFAGVTLSAELQLTLKGSADVTARTSIGNLPISAIPFNVPSGLKGINSFGHEALLSNISVTGSGGIGGSEFIIAPLTSILNNPSNISLDTVGISLPVIFDGTKIGRAVIDPFHLVPGENPSATEFRYQPDNANDTSAQAFLSEFIQTGNNLDLSIHGDQNSSPFQSLSPGLAQLELKTSISGLNQPTFITRIEVTITLDTLINDLVTINFDVRNPLDADLVIEFVQSDSGVNGLTYAQFGHPFPSFVIPPGQTVNSGPVPNVLLTQGALASLEIIPLGILDVSAATTLRVGVGGYLIPWLKLEQKAVPTTYNLVLELAQLKAKAKQIKATSSSTLVSTSRNVTTATPTSTMSNTTAEASSLGAP